MCNGFHAEISRSSTLVIGYRVARTGNWNDEVELELGFHCIRVSLFRIWNKNFEINMIVIIYSSIELLLSSYGKRKSIVCKCFFLCLLVRKMYEYFPLFYIPSHLTFITLYSFLNLSNLHN